MVDMVGLYFVFSDKKMLAVAGDIDVKVLSVGLGWATAELATTYLVDIIFQQGWANGLKMEYIVSCFAANCDLLEIISLAFLAYALTRKEASTITIYGLVLVRYLVPVGLQFYKSTTESSCELCLMGARAAFAIVFYFCAKAM